MHDKFRRNPEYIFPLSDIPGYTARPLFPAARSRRQTALLSGEVGAHALHGLRVRGLRMEMIIEWFRSATDSSELRRELYLHFD